MFFDKKRIKKASRGFTEKVARDIGGYVERKRTENRAYKAAENAAYMKAKVHYLKERGKQRAREDVFTKRGGGNFFDESHPFYLSPKGGNKNQDAFLGNFMQNNPVYQENFGQPKQRRSARPRKKKRKGRKVVLYV